jgi:hypothetical protein
MAQENLEDPAWQTAIHRLNKIIMDNHNHSHTWITLPGVGKPN